MEALVKEEMVAHLDRHKLLKKSQHGFMKGRSCTTNLLEFLETVTSVLDGGKCMDVIYLDFSKAFDLVPTKKLLAKVGSHGISGPTLIWLEKWLSDRMQRVVLNGKASTWKPVTSGVPQGSILGPILFAIYINDLEDDFEDDITTVKKFADDTKLGQEITSVEDNLTLQSCLDRLWGWACRWDMKFNLAKCHVLHLGNRNQEYIYSLGGETLTSVEEERDIGVIITSNLKPAKHCEKAACTANRVLSQVLRAFSYRDKNVLPQIYKTYVRPHIEFASPVWNPWSKGDVDLLENVQKRMVKQIKGLSGTSYEEKIREIGLESLEERRNKQDLIQTFKIIHGYDKVSSNTWFKFMDKNRQHRTRLAVEDYSLEHRRARLDLRHNFFSHRTTKTWNNLPPDVRKKCSVTSFKHSLKKLKITVELAL